MRSVALIVALSLAAPLQSSPESEPSSLVIDLLDESMIVDKDINEINSVEDFVATDAEVSLDGDSETEQTSQPESEEPTQNSRMESLQEGDSHLQELDASDTPDTEPQSENEPQESRTASEQPPPDEDVVQSPNDEDVEHIEPSDQVEPSDQSESGSETDDYTVLSDPVETDGFHVAGVTWSGSTPQQIDVRTLIDAEWTDWINLEIEATGEGTPGTEPFMAAGSEGVQVRATGEVLPDTLKVHLMTGEGSSGSEQKADTEEPRVAPEPDTELEEAENATSETARPGILRQQQETSTPSGQPARQSAYFESASLKSVPFSQDIVSRSSWGAPTNATWRPRYVPVEGAIVHHTAGTNNYSRAQAPGIVKGIWNFHTYTRGWGDIGYNFLIDKYGTVYEGRDGSLKTNPGEMSIGAHAAPANTGSVGVSVLGSYTGNVTPSSTVLNTIADVIAWQFSMANVDPHGTFTYSSGSGSNISTNAISGHRDISATTCPGNIYPQLSTIRSTVASKIDDYAQNEQPVFQRVESSGKGWPKDNAWSMGDFTGNGSTDLLLRNSSGRIVLYQGRGDNSFESGRQIGRGWNNFRDLYAGVDFDGDSIPDLLAINHSNQLFLYPGNGSGGFKNGRQIGHGWTFEHLILMQDGASRNPAIAGISADGSMYLYSTNGQGGFTATNYMGTGFSHLQHAVAVGDWDRSGFSDVITVYPSGRLHYFSDPTEQGFSGSVQIGRGWAGLTILSGDTAGQYHDLLTISSNGRLSTYIFQR